MALVPPASTDQVMLTIDKIEMVEKRNVSSPLWEKDSLDSCGTSRDGQFIYLSDLLSNIITSSSSERIVVDNLRKERRILFSLLEEYSIQDDEIRPIDFFDELLEKNEKAICFEQIRIIFQTAYSKGLTKMANNVLLFLSNYDHNDVGEIGVAIVSMALQNKDNYEMQNLSLSLINKWKSKGFKRVISHYQVPNDIFLKLKFKKTLSIFR